MLVGIAHHETDGQARGLSLEHTTEQVHLVGLVARRGNLALSRAAARELMLNEVHVNVYTCRHPVNDAPDGRAMTLTKRRKGEDSSKSIAHDYL